MVLMQVFCLFCSVRFGTLCIAVVTLVHGIASLLFLALSFSDLERTSNVLYKIFDDLKIKDTIVRKITEHLEIWLSIATLYFAFLSVTSALAIIGTIKCRRNLLYPFVALYGVYVLLLLTYNVVLMLHFRQNDASLGLFILYCNLGGFTLLYFLYKWFCVISFIQILKEISEEIDRRHEIEEMKTFPFTKRNTISILSK